jgi:hypothetical protein
MNRRYIFGLGTGRCGSMTLANLLTLQDDCIVSHEIGGYPHLSWIPNSESLQKYLNKISVRKNKVIGDVAFYTLPYAKFILERYPDTKFVVLQRDREETINSYMKKTEGRNHWMPHNGTQWSLDVWDKCYPKFHAETKKEALGKYYDLYYTSCGEIPKDSIYWLKTAELNDESKCLDMLSWCGFERPRYLTMQKNRGNK